MTKIEIIKSVVKQTGVDKEIVAKVIDAYASTIKSALIGGNTVNFRNFGTFYLKHRAAKTARNITKIQRLLFLNITSQLLSLLRNLLKLYSKKPFTTI